MRVADTDVTLMGAVTMTASFQVTLAHMLSQDSGVSARALQDLAERYEEQALSLRRRVKALGGAGLV